MKMWPPWTNWKVWLKLVGLLFLVAYFWQHPPHVDFIWVVAYVGLAIATGAIFALIVNPILPRIFPTQDFDPSPYGDSRLAQAKRRPWMELILLMGEDGFFFVPLLLFGINAPTAVLIALLYAAIHYPEFPLKYCLVKAVVVFLVITLVLPNGLGSVIVGHLILDTLAYYFWNHNYGSQATDA